MKQCIYKIESNEPLTQTVYKMRLSGDTSAFSKPGQFLNIALDGLFLRRPISVCDYDETGLTILYKVVGKGTAQMASMQSGETLDVLTGLGNGYDVEKCGVILEKYIDELVDISADPHDEQIMKAVEKTVKKLNKLNEACECELLDSTISDDICEFIHNAAVEAGLSDIPENVCDEWREF